MVQELVKHGLKVTPQRIAVLEALKAINGHPTADNVIEFIRKNHPHISTGTIYKTLETFTEKGLTKKVKTAKELMRYELSNQLHHHLYSSKSDRIEDYYDDELNELLSEYFKKKPIQNFTIDDIKLQITGNFKNGDKP